MLIFIHLLFIVLLSEKDPAPAQLHIYFSSRILSYFSANS